MRSFLQKTAVILLVIASLYSLARYWDSTIDLEMGAQALAAWEARLEPARRALPIQRGVIGYVGEWDVPGVEYNFWDQEGEYLLAQYTLAPFILVKGAQAEWNVAVLSNRAFEIWEQSNQGKFDIIRLKHNVYLLHRIETH